MKHLLGTIAAILLMAPCLAFAQQSPGTGSLRIAKGDILTFNYSMAGNLLGTLRPTKVELQAKQNMWVRMSGSNVEASLDDLNFRPISQFASGTLDVGVADASGSTFAVNLTVNAK
jgi:hypothetical protein